jgi:hypothetical protein
VLPKINTNFKTEEVKANDISERTPLMKPPKYSKMGRHINQPSVQSSTSDIVNMHSV